MSIVLVLPVLSQLTGQISVTKRSANKRHLPRLKLMSSRGIITQTACGYQTKGQATTLLVISITECIG